MPLPPVAGRKSLPAIVLIAAILAGCLAGAEPGPNYVPEPEIAELVRQAAASDHAAAQKAIEQLAGKGDAAERALNYYLFKEATPAARARYAELLARCNLGRVGYRIELELQPDGSGILTLWSDRALLAECGKRYAHIMNEPEPVYDDAALRQNPFGKAELMRFMGEGMKFLEGRVETKDGRIEATGVLSFKNFDAFSSFADAFDSSGYYMIAGSTLSDRNGIRTLRYRKLREQDQEQYQRNLLLFHNVRWEFVLDFKGRLGSNNASHTEGARLAWSFNCYQMLKGEASIEAAYSSEGLQPRPGADEGVVIPAAVQAGQPMAIPRQHEIHAKVYKHAAETPRPSAKELREKGQLIELDGRASLPKGQPLQAQWVQTYGPDLNLSSESLAKDYVCLIIKESGEYHFELTVSANGAYSRPAEVKVYVEGGTVTAQAPRNTPQPATQPDLKKKPEPQAQMQPRTPAPAPAPEIVAKPPKAAPAPATLKPPKTEPKPEPQHDLAKAKELYAEGQKLLKTFDFTGARAKFERAQKLGLEDVECNFDLGTALLELGEYKAAILEFEPVADSKSPRVAHALMNLGHCYARIGSFEQARGYYRQGTQIGKDAVMWETLWQLGNKQIAAKDYETALSYLKEAEGKAAQAGVRDWRLLRDCAIALHASGADGEALKRLEALQALGYSPDPKLLQAVKEKAGAVAVMAAKPASEKPPELKTPVATKSPAPTSPPALAQKIAEPPAQIAQVKALPPVSPPVATKTASAEAKNEPPKTEARQKPPQSVADATPLKPLPEPRSKPRKPRSKRVVIPKKPLPPVPADFKEALTAGRKALETGEQATRESGEARERAYQSFDEAEAMLRGAWQKKPGDPEVVAAFEQLTKYVGAIALAKNTYIKARVRGLVVLDAEPSIAPRDKEGNPKPLYYAWEQVEGEPLEQRPEDLAMRKVGLRIPRPGVYKFDLAVSDGARSGNPVTVTIEVVE